MQILETTNSKKEIFWKLTDRHYLTLWDARDLDKVNHWCKKIRETHDEQTTRDFFILLDRKWNDHRTNLAIEPLDLSLNDDVMTYKGIGKMCRLVTQQDNDTFNYVAVGTGAPTTTNALPFYETLVSEEYHIGIDTNGFLDASGTTIRYGGTFGAESVTDFYNESLVRTKANFSDAGNITLCMTFFNDQPISHTQGNTGFTAAGSIEFSPIADIDFP